MSDLTTGHGMQADKCLTSQRFGSDSSDKILSLSSLPKCIHRPCIDHQHVAFSSQFSINFCSHCTIIAGIKMMLPFVKYARTL